CAGLTRVPTLLSVESGAELTRLGGLDITVARNAYGRQRESFVAPLTITGMTPDFDGTFIRAPQIVDTGSAEVLARHDGTAVLVRQGDVWGASFHPELGPDTRLHAEFVRRLGHDD
ncbi:pyridoxal 5'-phosphate synthase glutaminase subunit PdxT, partial [Burkholderia multivorans]